MSSASPRIEPPRRTAEAPPNDIDTQGLEALRALLLSQDRGAIDALTARLDRLEAERADPAARRAALESILLDAVRGLQQARFAETSSAFAPLVIGTIRTEIVNSREAMVEALYPITGRLVTAAVSDAFRKLLDQINARIEGMTSRRSWSLRARAVLTGRSMGEVVLSELGDTGLRRVLLIERGSGVAVARWAAPAQKKSGGDDDIVSGLITVISALAEDAFEEGDASLRSVDLNGRSVVLHASPGHIIAVEVAATLPQTRQMEIHDACVAFLSHWSENPGKGAQDDVSILSHFATTLSPRAEKAPERKTAKYLVGAALMAFMALALWSGWSSWRLGSAEAGARAVIAANPALEGWPVTARAEDGGLSLRGTLPPGFNRAALERDIRAVARGLPVAVALAPLDAPQTRAALARLEARADPAPALAMLAAENTALEQRLARLEAALTAMPGQALLDWAGNTRLTFLEGNAFADPAAAEAALAQGAAYLSRTGATLSVVGHSDALGTAARREAVAIARARAVADQLRAMGAPEGQVRAVGRANTEPLDDRTGPGAPSRRVTFEVQW